MEEVSNKQSGLPEGLQVRRATVEDLEALRKLWESLGFGGLGLDKSFQEFQVAASSEAGLIGCIGLKIVQRDGWIHHSGALKGFEGVEDLLWNRLLKVIENNGLVRVWADGSAWETRGFREPTSDALQADSARWRIPSCG